MQLLAAERRSVGPQTAAGAILTLRERILRRLKRSIERRGYPRTALVLILGFSGLLSFVLSILLLEIGVSHMGVRYVACLAIGYLIFLVLLRFWSSRYSEDLDPGLDIPGGTGSSSDSFSGGGGRFSGGGASGGWEPEGVAGSIQIAPDSGSSVADATGGFDLDEAWPLAIPILVLAGAALAGGYVVAMAPVLLAEVALDVAIAAGAYRAASRLAPRYWAVGAIRRTWLVALSLAVILAVFGSWLQAIAPNAHTIGAAVASL